MTESDIIKYFTAEKNESLIFVALGMVAISLAFYGMFSLRTDFFRGMFYPLILIGLIQLVVGGSVYLRSPKDIERVSAQFNNDPEKLETEEMPRMIVVNKNFMIYRYTEIALALVGVFFFLSFNKESFYSGLGIGLATQAIAMLCADYFAEQRAREYTEILKFFLHLKFTA